MFNDKIIFAKGETEKLLNYQFYNSSYKACCEIKKENSMDNNCFKTNYQNNWKLVRKFTEEKKINSLLQQEKYMNKTNLSTKKKWVSLHKKKLNNDIKLLD